MTARQITGVKYEPGNGIQIQWEELSSGDAPALDKCSRKFANEPRQAFKQALDDLVPWLMQYLELGEEERAALLPRLAVCQVKLRRDDSGLEAQLIGNLSLRKNKRQGKLASADWIHEEEEGEPFGEALEALCAQANAFLDGERLPIQAEI